MEKPVIFINILFRRPCEAAAVSYKVLDIFREISRKCIMCYQPNINMKKEFEIIQFVSKLYFSKFHLLTGFMNPAWWVGSGMHFQDCEHLQKSRVEPWKNVNIYILRKMEFSGMKYLHQRQRTKMFLNVTVPPSLPPRSLK